MPLPLHIFIWPSPESGIKTLPIKQLIPPLTTTKRTPSVHRLPTHIKNINHCISHGLGVEQVLDSGAQKGKDRICWEKEERRKCLKLAAEVSKTFSKLTSDLWRLWNPISALFPWGRYRSRREKVHVAVSGFKVVCRFWSKKNFSLIWTGY